MAPAIVDTVDELTPEWFTAALREGGTIDEGVTVTSASSQLVGTGQLGLVVRTDLEYDVPGGPASLITKLPSLDPGSRQMGVVLRAYEAEVRFYQEVLPYVDARVPAMHWGDVDPSTGRFTLVIDNLAPGSVAGDMIAGCDMDRAELAIMELVKLQAPGWNAPSLHGISWLADESRTQMFFDGVPAAVGPFLDRLGSRLEPEHAKLVQELGPKAPAYPTKAWHQPFAVVHGDYRLDNVMFGVDSAAEPVSIIDWQAVRLGPPLVDVAVFLGSCVDPEDRRAHEREMIARYHDGLVRGGVTSFSVDDAWESYRHSALWPFLLGIVAVMTLERTERGDELFARMVRDTADLIQRTGAAQILD